VIHTAEPDLVTPEGFTPDEWKIARTLIDPVFFSAHWFGVALWKVQQAILRSVATRARTAVKSCHASGKTFLSALAALWWITRYPDGIVITTAPTWKQVEKMVWSEVHGQIRRSKIRFPEPTKTSLYATEDNYVLGMATREGVRFQGFHGRVLIIIDEAMGVSREIFEAIEGIRAGGDVRLLLLFNPTIPSGPAYDVFASERALWGDGLFTISAFDTPNLEGLSLEDILRMGPDELAHNPWPMLTTRSWVRERFEHWGGTVAEGPDGKLVITDPTHPGWFSRVLGQFPGQGPGQLFGLQQLERAERMVTIATGNQLGAGIDVAGPGEDETVLYIVDLETGSILLLKPWGSADPRKEVIAALEPWRTRLVIVNVDADGMGYYFAKDIEAAGYPVAKVHVGIPARNKRRFKLRKDEYYWGLSMRANAGELAGLTDQLTVSQLTSIRYSENDRGQIVIESKEDMRDRGVKGSPDRAEALMLAFAPSSLSRTTGIPVGSGTSDPDDQERKQAPYESQFESSPIGSQFREAKEREQSQGTCGGCSHFRVSVLNAEVGRCEARAMNTKKAAPECQLYDGRE
jgi:hypothetical protein